MRRRTLLKGAALGTAAALGAGYWALPAGPRPAVVSLEGARQVLADLQGKTLQSIRGWSPSEVFNHCAQSIDYSIDGYPELKAAWFRHSLGPAAFAVFSARGAMRHPLDEAIPGAAALDEPASHLDLDSVDALVARFVAAARPGDHVLCMSNGGFGGVHDRLLKALAR